MGYKTFNNKLYDLITKLTSTDDSQPFAKSYNWANAEPEGFPCALVYQANGSTETNFQTRETLSEMKFVIRVVWEAKDYDDEINQQLLEAEDLILAKLRTPDYYGTLGGEVHSFEITSIDPVSFTEAEPYIGFQISVVGKRRNCQT